MAPHAYYRYNLPLLLRNAGRLNLWRYPLNASFLLEALTEQEGYRYLITTLVLTRIYRICMVSGGGAETSTELLRHLLPNRNICDRHSKCASNPVTTISTPNF